MLVTVTNTSASLALNRLAVAEDGIATGGQRLDVLPYPFGHVIIAASGNLQLPVQPIDFHDAQTQMRRGSPTRERWNRLAQSGRATVAIAAQTGRRDVQELYITAV